VLFHGKAELIFRLMAATHLKKVGIGAAKGWKSKLHQTGTCCN